jgi:hypothetical protein
MMMMTTSSQSGTVVQNNAHDKSSPCWSCGAKDDKSMFFCRTCDAIQAPPTKTDVFTVFGCAETFDVDVGDISRRFKQLQVKLHPDKWASRTPVRVAVEFFHSSKQFPSAGCVSIL